VTSADFKDVIKQGFKAYDRQYQCQELRLLMLPEMLHHMACEVSLLDL